MTYQYSASIVLYQSPKNIVQKAINSFIMSTPEENRVLILIDHSPKDNLKHELDLKHPNIQYYHHPENRGYGAGHNIAIRLIIDESPIHFIINPDVYFDNDVLDKLSTVLLQNNNIGSLMPKIINQHGETQHLAKLIPRPIDVFGKRFLPKSWMKKSLDRFQLKFTGYNKVMNVPYLSGCFMCIRTMALQKVGLFDERFFMYPEDIDLSRRIHEHFETLYYPNIHITHLHEASSYKSLKMLKIHIINMVKYFNKWGWILDKKRKKYNKKALQNITQSA